MCTYTVFPHIVSAETILFWIWKSKYIRPKVTVHKGAETTQGRKLFRGGNYMRKYGRLYGPYDSSLEQEKVHIKIFLMRNQTFFATILATKALQMLKWTIPSSIFMKIN